MLRDRILNTGTNKINKEYTRSEIQPGGRTSCLDHIYTTHPEKITNNHNTEHSTFSDHSMVMMNKRIKKLMSQKSYIKIRSMKNFNIPQYRENISNHNLFISTLYEAEPQVISDNITTILQDSLKQMAPVVRIQLSQKKQNPLSTEAIEALCNRDIAHLEAKENPSLENSRQYKNLRNQANSIISKERHFTKRDQFQTETSTRKMWKMTKEETGQAPHTSPTIIREGTKYFTKLRDIATSLNRQYLSIIRETINSIPKTNTNPMNLYSRSLGRIDSKLDIQQNNMNELKKVLSSMSATTSTTSDYLSMKVIKDAGPTITSHLLHLVNRIIATQDYPVSLKITKVIPIKKPHKDSQLPSGWRPINIVPSLSKVVDKFLLGQVVTYLQRNNLIHHTHHGSVGGKSTQTLVQEVYDRLLTAMENGKDSAFMQLDQSKAYNVIDHDILLEKMKYLGFNSKTVRIFMNYMSDRKQYVEVQSFPSERLLVGPRSVTQGSTLSCIMYLIYIMDITQIFHQKPHNPEQYKDCNKTNAKSFVDDNLLHVQTNPNQDIKPAITETMGVIEDYMNANLPALNADKTKIMLISTNDNIKKHFNISIGGKDLMHQPTLTVLGNVFTEDLRWEKHVETIVIPSLANRMRTLKYVSGMMSQSFRKVYATAILKGKLTHAIDAWGGTNEQHLSKIQAIQDRVTKSVLGHKKAKLSSQQREKELGWLSVRDKVKLATLRMTHKVVHQHIPEELACSMPLNTINLRLIEAKKLDTKPRALNKNKRTRASFRSRAYTFNTLPNRLTAIVENKRFNKWLKVFLRNPAKLPKPIPKVEPVQRRPNPTSLPAPKMAARINGIALSTPPINESAAVTTKINGIADQRRPNPKPKMAADFNGIAPITQINGIAR